MSDDDRIYKKPQNFLVRMTSSISLLGAAQNRPSGNRLEQINVIKRFFHSSHSLMLLVGEQDSGKTALLADVVLQMGESRPMIRLEGNPNLHPAQFVDVVSKHWALQPANGHERVETQLDAMSENLRKHFPSCILIIDDADLLSLSVLAAISHLVTQQDGNRIHLHILLSGQPSLAEKINSLLTKEILRLTIGALSREEAFRKIKGLLDHAGLHLPYAAENAIFAKLYQNSEGMPKTLENLVKKLISQHTPPLTTNALRSASSSHVLSDFWKAHRIKMLTFFGLLTLGYLFWAWQHHPLNSSPTSQKTMKNLISTMEPQHP